MQIPKSLQGVLWSKDTSKLNLTKDKEYIIHQTLAYGGWEHLKWLFGVYKLDQIKKVFIRYPEKDYSFRSFNFIQKIVLGIPSERLDKRYYVKTFPRIVR